MCSQKTLLIKYFNIMNIILFDFYSSCDTPSGRDEYVQELMKFIQIDSYGLCLHNKNLPPHLREPQKMKDVEFLHILAKYKFVLAIENAVCDDYITEKLWKVIQVRL